MLVGPIGPFFHNFLFQTDNMKISSYNHNHFRIFKSGTSRFSAFFAIVVVVVK